MTFDNAAWAINGAELSASLARREVFASTGGNEGVVNISDLKVTQLGVPGVGVQIAPGVALVLNRYQASPNETYVASNPGVHTIPSSEMPAANPAAKSYLVAVVIGDPDFSQAGHPWMGADDPEPGEETTFQYVRPTIIEVPAGTKTAAGLGYPAVALARIDVPASTTTITDSMITDLREVAQPRSKSSTFVLTPPRTTLTSAAFVKFPNAQATVKVPAWATKAQVIVHLAQMVYFGPAGTGGLRARLGTLTGATIGYDLDTPAGAAERSPLVVAGTFDIPDAMKGTSQDVYTEASRSDGTGYLDTWDGTAEIIQVIFTEE